ncbi:U32 family peptidase [bacterium]|nr:U32 family peptidase [bacterium]
MKRIELLLPAGNLEKLKMALTYGADACYIGAKEYSLRAQASNFTLNDIKEAVEFAHNLNKKVYITVNVIPREKEIMGILPYLKKLESINIDGIIVSSPVILYIAKRYTNLHISISTQMSVTNTRSVNFFNKMGAKRVVLARELSIDEIREIRKNTECELEVFIHGGMCSGYSGRCTLSNYMSSRDANRGGCAHSCRWNYDLYMDQEKINKDYPFQIASKDLEALDYIKDLCLMGIDSLKIEGRMKSLHYVATLSYTYRKLIDDISSNTLKDMSYYKNLLKSSENRMNSSGFFSGKYDYSMNLYSKMGLEANQSFLGIVLDYDNIKKEALIEVRNHFKTGEVIEVMSPNKDLYNIKIENIYKDGILVDSARHALEKLVIKVDKDLLVNDILRRVQDE